ncbi:hypothetical protein [Streptomyces flaveolus]|uniref:hypothetical protein n=1 Tax=Streptomyces flaveolus TaxID=67297 RepID=UPI0036F75AE6
MSRQDTAELRREAAQSAGRTAGYCWVKFGTHQRHCTRPPEHDDDHKSYYHRDVEDDE